MIIKFNKDEKETLEGLLTIANKAEESDLNTSRNCIYIIDKLDKDKNDIEMEKGEGQLVIDLLDIALREKGFSVAPQCMYFLNKVQQSYQENETRKDEGDANEA